MVFSTDVVASSITASSAGAAIFITNGVRVSAGAGAGVLWLILNRDVCVCGWLAVWAGPSPGYPNPEVRLIKGYKLKNKVLKRGVKGKD